MNLQQETFSILKQNGISPNKRLGQNFLISDKVLNKIIETSDLKEGDIVLEIGSGLGTMTSRLARLVKHVYAIESDRRIFEISSRVCDIPNVTLSLNDALKMEFSKLLKGSSQLAKVVSNPPYYITTPLLMKLLDGYELFESHILMVQKEVGERIVAKPGQKEYGALTLAVSYRCEAEISANVPAKSFFPKPEVDSVLLKLVVREQPAVEVKDEQLFFKIIRAGFGQRRKMLKNALELASLNLPEKVDKILTELDIDPKRRGETLSMSEFAALANRLYVSKLIADK